jgi:hypothetical protein
VFLPRALKRSSRPILAALLCLCFGNACMTLDSRVNPDYNGPPLYAGVRGASGNFKAAFMTFNAFGMILATADIFACLIADTLLLPLTAVEQSKWSEARVNRARTDLEQPSLVFPAEKEDPLRTARRLFRACENLARNLNPQYIDCYSIGSKIELTDEDGETRSLDGKAYKEEVKAIILARRGGTRFVRYLDPQYELEGNRVRVRATREESGIQERNPIEFVFGAGEDGGWRILEERSRGWR